MGNWGSTSVSGKEAGCRASEFSCKYVDGEGCRIAQEKTPWM